MANQEELTALMGDLYRGSGSTPTDEYKSYLESIAQLYQFYVKNSFSNVTGLHDALSEKDLTRMRELYQNVFSADQKYREAAEKQGLQDTVMGKDRLETMRKFRSLLQQDQNSISQLTGKNDLTLDEILYRSRANLVDITGMSTQTAGEAMSQRVFLPVQEGAEGNAEVTEGFFTPQTTRSSYEIEKEQLIKTYAEKYPKIMPAILGYFKNYTRYNHDVKDIIAAENLEKALWNPKEEPEKFFSESVKETLNATYEGDLLFADDPASDEKGTTLSGYLKEAEKRKDFPEELKGFTESGLSPEDREKKVSRYIESLQKDKDFPMAFMGFIKEEAAIANRHNVLALMANIESGSNIEQRNAAMTTVADLLGVPTLIARSVPMQVVNGNTVTTGVYMEKAKGSDLLHMKPGDPLRKVTAQSVDTPSAKRQLADLQVLDFLCGNVDRHPGNMFYQVDDKGNLLGVQGIDNDCSFGKIGALKDSLGRMVGLDNMMVMSRSMADKISGMTPEMLKTALKNYPLSKEELDAAGDRLQGLRSRILEGKNYFKTHPKERLAPGHIRVVDDNAWNSLSLDELATGSKTAGAKGQKNYFNQIRGLDISVKAEFQAQGAKQRLQRRIDRWTGKTGLTAPEQTPKKEPGKEPKKTSPARLLSPNSDFRLRALPEDRLKLDSLIAEHKTHKRGWFSSSLAGYKDLSAAMKNIRSAFASLNGNKNDPAKLKELYEGYRELRQGADACVERAEKEKKLSTSQRKQLAFAKVVQEFAQRQSDKLGAYLDVTRQQNQAQNSAQAPLDAAITQTDKVSRLMAQYSAAGNGGKQFLNLMKIGQKAYGLLGQVLERGKQGADLTDKLRADKSGLLETVVLCEKVLNERYNNGGKPGSFEQELESKGCQAMVSHMRSDQNFTRAKQSLSLNKLGVLAKNSQFHTMDAAPAVVKEKPASVSVKEKPVSVKAKPVSKKTSPNVLR